MQKLHMNDIINSPLNKPQENFSAKSVTQLIQTDDIRPEERTPYMKIHIEINSYGKNGDVFRLEGDVCNQSDLAAIHERFKDHMPRKKFWGLL